VYSLIRNTSAKLKSIWFCFFLSCCFICRNGDVANWGHQQENRDVPFDLNIYFSFWQYQLPIYHILKFGTVNICCITHSRWKLHQSSFIRQDVIPSLAHNLIQSIFFCYIIKVLCLLRVVWHCLPIFLVNKR
jgi:hypothetical protein